MHCFLELHQTPTPLQNAGCGHLHHAHCVYADGGTVLTGCPSGCHRVARELVVFDVRVPHITVLWDGDKIDKIPVPLVDAFDGKTPSRLNVDKVVWLVEELLTRKGYAQPGLSLKIHSRDAISE